MIGMERRERWDEEGGEGADDVAACVSCEGVRESVSFDSPRSPEGEE